MVAQKFHGHVNFAKGLHRRILGQRRLHLRRQLQEWDLHDMGSVYRSRSGRSNFWLPCFVLPSMRGSNGADTPESCWEKRWGGSALVATLHLEHAL